MPLTLDLPENNVKHAVRLEIESQIIKLDIDLKKEKSISFYVSLLSKKRQLQELLNQCNNEN
jgi:hypothetical protein